MKVVMPSLSWAGALVQLLDGRVLVAGGILEIFAALGQAWMSYLSETWVEQSGITPVSYGVLFRRASM